MADALVDARRLEEALASPTEEVRYVAIRAIADRSDGAYLGLLLRALGDESWKVRREAVEILAASEEREAVMAALTEILGSHVSESVHRAASEALLLLGKAAFPALTRALASGPPEARRHAAEVLGDLGEPAAVRSLAGALVDADRRVRVAAAEALGQIGTETAAQALILASESVQDLGTRLACLDALAELRRAPSTRLLVEAVKHAATRRVALRLLAFSPQPEAVPVCLEALSDRAPANRAAALVALEALRHEGLSGEEFERARDALADDDFRVLREGMRSTDVSVFRAAAALAGWLGTTSLALDLSRAVRDPHRREIALASLADMSEAAAQALGEQAAAAPPSDRAAILSALGTLSAEMALPLCREAIDDPHPMVSAAAAGALATLGSSEDMPALLRAALRSARPYLSAAIGALRSLGERDPGAMRELILSHPIGTRDDVDAQLCEMMAGLGGIANLTFLETALAQGGPRTREAAASALADLGATDAIRDLFKATLDEDAQVRAAALKAIAGLAREIGGETREHVATTIRVGVVDPDEKVRAAAAGALAALGSDVAFPELADLAASTDGEVALSAIAATRAMGGEAHLADRLATFENALRSEDPDVVCAGVSGLAEVRDPAAILPLSTCLSHPRFEVRIAAAHALATRGEAAHASLRVRLGIEDDPLVREALRRALALTPPSERAKASAV
jgi:HEAT repeat protein